MATTTSRGIVREVAVKLLLARAALVLLVLVKILQMEAIQEFVIALLAVLGAVGIDRYGSSAAQKFRKHSFFVAEC